MKQTKLLGPGAALVAACLLAACAPSGGSDSDPKGSDSGGSTTLTVWSWQQPMAKQWDQVFAGYEKQHPDVDVQFKGFQDYDTVLKTGLSGAEGPDVVMLHPYNSIEPYVKAGQLAAINASDIAGLDAFSQDSIDSASSDGKLYGVPFAQQTIQIFYDKDIFDEVGVEPPSAPEDVTPMLDKLVAADVIPFAVTGKDTWQLVNVFDALAGPTYGGAGFVEGAREGSRSFTDADFVGALEQFKSLESYFPANVAGVTYTDSQALFNSGRAAMFPGGSWELQGFQAANPEKNIGVFSMPAADGSRPTWGYEDGSFGISARSEHQDQAMDLLSWMATPEFGSAFTEQLKQASSVPGVIPNDPILAEMVDNYRASPVPMIWVTDYFGVSSPAPYAALMNATQNLLIDKVDAEGAAADIQASVEEFTGEG